MLTDIEELAAGYRLNCKEHQISITASRINSHRDGRVTAEFAVYTRAPGYAGLLHRSQINLLSTRSRQALCKELSGRYEAPWAEIIEEASSLLLERIRQGQPLQYLSTEAESQPTQYLIDPIVPFYQTTCIFGLPGTMKSYTAILACVLVTLPWYDNQLGLKMPETPSPCLYLDWESSYGLVNQRLKKLQLGHELPPISFAYRHCALPLADDIEQIKKMADECRAKFLIIDSLGGACGGDIYSPEPALRFFGALRALPQVTPLILAHTSKDMGKEKTILGTVYFWAYSRQIWETKSTQEAGQTEVTIGLFHRKANEDQLHKPLGFQFCFTPESVTVARADVRESFLEQLSLAEQVKEVLRGGAMTLAEISEETGAQKNQVSLTLSRLRNKGQVVRLPQGKWGLAQNHQGVR